MTYTGDRLEDRDVCSQLVFSCLWVEFLLCLFEWQQKVKDNHFLSLKKVIFGLIYQLLQCLFVSFL
jgi:hypothetical protein